MKLIVCASVADQKIGDTFVSFEWNCVHPQQFFLKLNLQMHGNGRVNEVNMGHLQRGWFHTPMIFSNRWTIHMTYRFIYKHLSFNIPRIWYTLNVSKILVAFAPKRSFTYNTIYMVYMCVSILWWLAPQNRWLISELWRKLMCVASYGSLSQ